jgi:adenine specific DNA methylase Mod
MTDTPTYKLPVDPQEQPILQRMERIRDDLSLLKADRSTYIRSEDIMALYDEALEQVHELNEIRRREDKPTEQNRGACANPTVFVTEQCSGYLVGRLLPVDIVGVHDDRAQ